jgi:transposase-like protein
MYMFLVYSWYGQRPTEPTMSKAYRNDPQRAKSSQSRYTFYEFDGDFPDDAACMEWLVGFLYPDGIFCPKCERVTKHHRVRNRTCYECQYCGHQEYPLVGTIFENSSTSLRLWFHAIFLMSQTRCGISAKQLERELGVTYKTAWRMANKIRSLLQDDDDEPLSGPVEADETYYGGHRRGTPRGRPSEDSHKTPVFGMAQRKGEDGKGRVVATTVQNTKRATVMPHIKKKVLPESMVYTDEYKVYDTLNEEGYQHDRVNHAEEIYVAGDVHTNTIDGFWSLLKRGIGGVYHSVSAKHLQGYLDEYSFRYNHRDDPGGMFNAFLNRVEKADSAS